MSSEVEQFVADETGRTYVSDWLEVDQPTIDAFADATKDWMFLHVDPEEAAKDGSPLVHPAHGSNVILQKHFVWGPVADAFAKAKHKLALRACWGRSSTVPIETFGVAAQWDVVCTTPCVVSNGSTQPAGTIVNKVIADPGWTPGPGLSLAPLSTTPIWSLPAPPATTLSSVAFQARFTMAEMAAIQASQVGMAAWLTGLNYAASNSGIIDVSSPVFSALMAQLVSANLLTSARAAQISNLSIPSP